MGTPGTNGGGGGGGSGGAIGIFSEGGISLADASLLIARGGTGGGLHRRRVRRLPRRTRGEWSHSPRIQWWGQHVGLSNFSRLEPLSRFARRQRGRNL